MHLHVNKLFLYVYFEIYLQLFFATICNHLQLFATFRGVFTTNHIQMKYAVVIGHYYIGFVNITSNPMQLCNFFSGFSKIFFRGGGGRFSESQKFFGCEPIESKKISNQDINFDSYIKITIQNIR